MSACEVGALLEGLAAVPPRVRGCAGAVAARAGVAPADRPGGPGRPAAVAAPAATIEEPRRRELVGLTEPELGP